MTHPLVAAARAQLGVKFKHQGRDTNGFDCAGLVEHSLRQCGYDGPPAPANYERHSQDESMLNYCRANLREVGTLAPGRIVVMRWVYQRHIGIVGDYPYGNNEVSLIHALLTSKKVVEQRLDESLRTRIMAIFEFPHEGF